MLHYKHIRSDRNEVRNEAVQFVLLRHVAISQNTCQLAQVSGVSRSFTLLILKKHKFYAMKIELINSRSGLVIQHLYPTILARANG